MKLRVGACALMLVLAGCSGESPESGMAGMRGVAASKAGGSLPTSLPLARAIGASIANAPDRGALLSFPNKATPAKQEGAYTWFPTAISEAHAFKAVATGEMTVPSPDGSQVKLRYERHVEETDGNWTWIGRVVGGDPMQEAIITFGEKAVFGSIPQGAGKPSLRLFTSDGTLWAVQTDPSKVVSANAGHEDLMVPEASMRAALSAAVQQAQPTAQAAVAVSQAAPPTSANTIDVVVGYTPEFAGTYGGGASAAVTRLTYLIQQGNTAFINSGINGYLRLVSAVQVNYTNTNTNQAALTELTGSNGSSSVTIPASLAPLREARDEFGGDVAILARKFNTPENEGCGIAWLNGADQTEITAADAPWGYAVISDGFDKGSDQKDYFCAEETLVHEVAHLMGSAHDRANSRKSNGTLQYGRYPYSFGYKTGTSAGNFYTIMAYGDVGQDPVRFFSTPLKTTCGPNANLVCGVANSEDNARSLNQTLPLVASFRAVVVPFPVGRKPVKSDLDGDGKSDIFMRHLSSDAYAAWFMRSYTQRLAKGGTLSAAHTPVATGDFDGDGIVDVLWTSAARDLVFSSYVNGVFRTTTSSSNYTAGYTVVGAGDLNGDRQSDVILFNPATNQFSVWFLANYARKSSAGGTLPAGHSLVAVGDFDGDGRDDMLWTTAARNLRFVTWKSGLQQIASTSAYTAGYAIAGSADVDGDGQSELVVHNAGNGAYSIWFLDDFARKSSRSATVPVGYRFGMAGDFTGGKREVILWTNNSRRIRFSPYGKDDVTSTLTYAAGYRILSTF